MEEDAAGRYLPLYPSGDKVATADVRSFITNFYLLSDNPEENERWISSFTEDAYVQMGADKAQGSEGKLHLRNGNKIRELRGRMWSTVKERKHRVLKAFPGQFAGSESQKVPESSKKDRKHAKESGGIAAAVTKQTAGKFSNLIGNGSGSSSSGSNSKSQPASNSSSPAINTPEIEPTVPPYNVNPAVSPMLDALSTTPVSASTAPSMTNEWARGGLAGSPGNLISIMGESPPTQPSSYEDPSRLHHGWTSQRPYMSPSPASASPPNNIRRPLSFQMEAQYQSPETPPQMHSAAYRRSSLHSPFPASRIGAHPPLPHQPQPHFYGIPDIDLNLTSNSGMKPGERGYFFGFDRLPSSPSFPAGSGKVVIAGYEGGLDVYLVSKRGLEPIGSLKGLRGSVLDAKILPWTIDGDKEPLFPLVAVVVHGPVLPQTTPGIAVQNDAASPNLDGNASPRSIYTHQDGFSGRQGPAIDSYQTSVEIYSLKTNKPVDVLLQAPKIPINPEVSVTNPIFRPPQPSGAFTIRADAGTIVVCSGITGECWVYLQLLEAQNGHIFTCVGKLWTSLQQTPCADVREEADKTHSSPTPCRPCPQTPILALNGRWIAYCPSSPSSQISIRAHVPLPILGKAPGISSSTPPQLPTVTASVDLPISDSVVNKIMRETTQELIQGAKWVGAQGLQAWNSYWNRSPGPQLQAQQARSPPSRWPNAQGDPGQFPPTHGSSGQAVSKEPGLVSIVDAESLTSSSSVHPLTTFATPLGCSFLSFSPSSLALFTASNKGDVQTVWDLLRIQHTRSSPLQGTVAPNISTGPQVRQIAQFSRMTVARIVDVSWTEPGCERIAMVTERGTVHLLDMPSSAFIWPPPRRRVAVQESGTATPEPTGSAVSNASRAFGAAYQAAKPFVTRPRRGSAVIPNVTGNTLKDSAAMGGRMIATSISSSLGKTGTAINQLRHTGENRVSLPSSSMLPSTACVAWVKSRKHHGLYVVGDGLVRTFTCQTRRSSVQAGRRVTRASRYKDFNVTSLPNDIVAPAVRQLLDLGAQEEILDLSERDLDAGNTLTLHGRPRAISVDQNMESSIPQAEIESSAPYQPFHTDRRVTICEYSRGTASQLEVVSAILADTHLEEKGPSKKKRKGQPVETPASQETPTKAPNTAWAFGQDIPVVKLDMGLPSVMEDDFGSSSHLALPQSAMERVMQYGDEEQIVVTTRRRRGAQQAGPGEDGFFEDDCEVLDFADQRV
ncbi:Fc.00g110490.m01.CDS01 [Cosmosporella sp. VM-42]